MTQFPSLSSAAKNIVNDFRRKIYAKGFFNIPSVILCASLYARSKSVDQKVIDILSQYIIDLTELLSAEQISVLEAEYTSVVNDCISQDCEDIARDPSMQMTPSSVVELCIRIAECKQGSKVFLPYCNLGEFSSHLHGCPSKGYELNLTKWALSQIVNCANKIETQIECSATYQLNPGEQFDYVFTCPPLGLRREAVDTIIGLLQNGLRRNGEWYAILPLDVCSTNNGGQGFDLRKTLADLKASVCVLSLPKNIFGPYTAISTCLFIIKLDGKGQIILADFSDDNYAVTHNVCGRKSCSLKVDGIIESLAKFDEKVLWQGQYSDLTGYLSLAPNRYLPLSKMPDLAPGEKIVKFGDLINVVNKTKLSIRTPKPIIGNRELSSDYLNCTLSAREINSSVKETASVIDQECLLVGFIGGKLKVAKLVDVNEGNGVALRSEVFAFTLNSSDVTEDYLLRSLLSDFSREQAVRMSSGVTISRISFEDLSNILITVPSIEEQEKICYNDAHVGIKDAELKLRQVYEDFRKDIHMKKHAMGQTMANLENWWSQLEKIRSQSNGIMDENVQIGRVRKISLKEILDRVHVTISKLSVQLDKFDTGYGCVKEEFALTEFIEEYIKSNVSPLFRYEYNSIQHRLSEDIPDVNADGELPTGVQTGNLVGYKGDPIEYVKFPKGALSIIFDNIISNACAYGFVGREGEDNIVRIEIKTDGTDYIVDVSNNGLPLDSAMSPEDVTIYGRTSGDAADHFGIGGYEVKRLMEEFGDTVKIIADASSDFPITYRLVFHDTNINSVLI